MNWNAFVLESDSWSLLFRQSIQITVLIVLVGLVTRFCLGQSSTTGPHVVGIGPAQMPHASSFRTADQSV